VSDAADAWFVTVNSQRIPEEIPDVRSAASIGTWADETICYCCHLTWPTHLLFYARDQPGRAYGCKSTFLELVGLIQPLLTVPNIVQGRKVVFLVNNLAVVYGWQNGYVKNDLSASVLICAMQIIAAFLGCVAHVDICPECHLLWLD
jgi:hypothetical protein